MVGRLFTSKNTICATFAQLLHKTQPRNPKFAQNFAQFFEVVENFVGRPRPSRKRNLLKNKWVTLFGMPNYAFVSKQKLPATLRNRLHNFLRACALGDMPNRLHVKHLAQKHREEHRTTPDNPRTTRQADTPNRSRHREESSTPTNRQPTDTPKSNQESNQPPRMRTATPPTRCATNPDQLTTARHDPHNLPPTTGEHEQHPQRIRTAPT